MPTLRVNTNSHLVPIASRYLVGVLLAACYVVLWHLSHVYRGLDHDAHLYALQALSRLNPDVYSKDIFFRFGSQDSYTIFTSIYASLIARVGLDAAASILTLTSTAMYFVGAWLLARRLVGSSVAWLSTGLLIVCELYYGGFSVFKTAEEFLTARLTAEAIGLCAIAAWLAGRRSTCIGLLLFAALIHPLMTVPVIALIALMAVPRQWHLRLCVAAAIGFAAVLLVATNAPAGPLSLIDDEWLSIIEARSFYLFPTTWPIDGWGRTTVVLATLLLGVKARSNSSVADVCHAALLVGVIGLLLAFATEAWPIKILVQGQPWRWLWIGSVVALLCLPGILAAMWADRNAGRACAVLLGAAWLMLEMSGGVLGLLCACLWLGRDRVTLKLSRWLNLLAVGVTAVTLAWAASIVHTMLQVNLQLGKEPLVIENIREVVSLTAPGVAVVCGLCLLAFRTPARVSSVLMAGLLAILVPLMAKSTVDRWTLRAFTPSTYVTFSDWRATVPPRTEVLWLWNPVPTWLLLERPNYMSLSQSAGLLFSRELAIEIDRRISVLDPLESRELLLAPNRDAGSARPLSRSALASICHDPQLGFVVANSDVGPAAGRHEWPREGQYVWLYDCSTFRQHGSAT